MSTPFFSLPYGFNQSAAGDRLVAGDAWKGVVSCGCDDHAIKGITLRQWQGKCFSSNLSLDCQDWKVGLNLQQIALDWNGKADAIFLNQYCDFNSCQTAAEAAAPSDGNVGVGERSKRQVDG